MEYTNHIMKAANAQAIQDALDAGTLVNPYVAMTSSGTLDFNSLSPSPIPSTGAWILTSDGDLIEGVYDSGRSEQSHFVFDDFSASTAATYTLYYGGSIVTADNISFQYHVVDGLETDRGILFEDTDYTVEDVPVIIDSGMSESLTEDYVDVFNCSFSIRKSDGRANFYVDIQIHSDMDVCTYWGMKGGFESYSDCRCNEYDDCPGPTMGNWSDDGEGNYTFQITETDTSYWEDNPAYIGQIASVIFHGSSTDMNITLEYSSLYEGWLLRFEDLGGESEKPEHTFYENGEPETWDDTGVQVAEGDSDAYVRVDWDGSGSFTFYSGSSAHPVSISTYDPEYPAGE